MCDDKSIVRELVAQYDATTYETLREERCPKPSDGPSLSTLVERAFQEVPVPAATVSIQPPKGKTLIGLETIFSAQAESFTRTLTLLGQQVQLRIEPSSYAWVHGDETTQATDWGGRAWEQGRSMSDYITHVYEHTGNVQPRVDVTWSAQFRVGGGAWQPVNGTVTITGIPTQLEIVEAEPKLVAP